MIRRYRTVVVGSYVGGVYRPIRYIQIPYDLPYPLGQARNVAAGAGDVIVDGGAVTVVAERTIRVGGAVGYLDNTHLEGAVAGTPGIAPTGWSWGMSGGTLVSVASASGYDYAQSMRISVSAARQYAERTTMPLASGVTQYLSARVTANSGAASLQNLLRVLTGTVAPTVVGRYLNGVAANATDVLPLGESVLELGFTVPSTGTVTARVGVGTQASQTADVTVDLVLLEPARRTEYPSGGASVVVSGGIPSVYRERSVVPAASDVVAEGGSVRIVATGGPETVHGTGGSGAQFEWFERRNREDEIILQVIAEFLKAA